MDPLTDVLNFTSHVCMQAVISDLVMHGTNSRRRILILRTRCISVKCFRPNTETRHSWSSDFIIFSILSRLLHSMMGGSVQVASSL